MEESRPAAAPDSQREPMTWPQLMTELHRTVKASLRDPLPAKIQRRVHVLRKERLLGMRALLNAELERLDRQETRAKQRKVTRITVQ